MDSSRDLIQSDNKEDVIEALFLAISQKDLMLAEEDLDAIESKFKDDNVSGWLFAYRVYRLSPQERNSVLRANINNKNPRIREHVCDIIGDEFILELRELLIQLFEDPVAYVSEAAKYNHNEMFDA